MLAPTSRRRAILSFVHGVTRARRRVFLRHGITTIDDLAAIDVAALTAAGVPSDGLDRMRLQAKALLAGRAFAVRSPWSSARRQARAVPAHRDRPLDHGEPFLVVLGEAAPGGTIDAARVAIVSTPGERADALRELVDVLESPAAREEPIYTYGPATARAFDDLAEDAQLDPSRAGDMAGRFVDLAPWVRRAAVLPVFLYRFDEVAAVARMLPRPAPGRPGDALFVLHAGLAASQDPEAVRRRLEEAGREALTLASARSAPGVRRDRAPSLWDRLARLLHRENHAILSRPPRPDDPPLDERVERGDSLARLAYGGEVSGRITLRCTDNLAKYRVGDALRLANGERAEGARGVGVVYESFDDATGTLIVSRDPFRPDGAFDPGLPLQLDPERAIVDRVGSRGAGARAFGTLRDRFGRAQCARRRSAANRRRRLRQAEAEVQAGRFVPLLDSSQREAFVAAMTADPVTLIQGPPGTGKTYVLARIVTALSAEAFGCSSPRTRIGRSTTPCAWWPQPTPRFRS